RPARAERRVLVGVGNDGYAKNSGFERRDGQADAVDGDGAFEDQITIELGGHANFEPPVLIAKVLERNQLARSVAVPLHDVVAQAPARRKRPLQVYLGAWREIAQVAALQCLWRKISRKPIAL